MHESLNLFASIVNNIHFKAKPFIIFLNKFDLFEEKVKRAKISQFFPDYEGDNRYALDKREILPFRPNKTKLFTKFTPATKRFGLNCPKIGMSKFISRNSC